MTIGHQPVRLACFSYKASDRQAHLVEKNYVQESGRPAQLLWACELWQQLARGRSDFFHLHLSQHYLFVMVLMALSHPVIKCS